MTAYTPEIPAHLRQITQVINARLANTWRTTTRARLVLLDKLATDKIAQGLVLDKCRRDPVFFIDHFCWLFEPRNPPKGLPALLPFSLYPRQRELVRWLQNREATSTNGAIPKSRGVGATWVAVAYSVWCWLFRKGFKITWGTLTEADLDAKNNPDSVFEKFRTIIKRLPPWFKRSMIPNFSKTHDNHRRLYNPDTGAVITGEIGDNMGRSGRSAIYFWDEAAHADFPEAKERAIQETTDCLIEISTPNGVDNPFAVKVRGALVDTLWMEWDSVPWRPPEWLEWRRLTRYAHDDLGFRQEILIDFLGSAEWTAIPPHWVQAAIDYPVLGAEQTSAGLDVARTADRNALTVRRGPCVELPLIWGAMPSHESAAKTNQHCLSHGVDVLSYDAIGVGEGITSWFGERKATGIDVGFDIIAIISSQSPTETIWSSERTAKELFLNLRAELYWQVRERFRKTYANKLEQASYPDEECISIPGVPELVAELGWLEYRHARGGKIKIESKDEMRKRRKTNKSPDLADSLIYAFADDVLEPPKERVAKMSWI